MASVRGQSVDRPPVSFYELNGWNDLLFDGKPEYNIYTDPSWRELLDITRDHTDRIHFGNIRFKTKPIENLTWNSWGEPNGNEVYEWVYHLGDKTYTRRMKREPDVDTLWTTQHLLCDAEDLDIWTTRMPDPEIGEPDFQAYLDYEARIGDAGVAMIETGDPLNDVASLFDMADYTIAAMTEPDIFHAALEKAATRIYGRARLIADALPGRLWRIYGPEYAHPPYLPPRLYKEYVVKYVRPLIDIIHSTGGIARVHCHGNLKEILPMLVEMGADATDPIEPPPQGNVSLAYVRQNFGKDLTLFGNLEVSDIETMRPEAFRHKIAQALDEGTAGEGRGFVLMPSACPIGRHVSENTLANYHLILNTMRERYGDF